MSSSPDFAPHSEANESTAESDKALQQLVADKYRTAYGITVDSVGAADLKATANLLYTALYEPENIQTFHEIQPSEKFPDRMPVLTATIPHSVTPPRELFVEAVSDATLRATDQEACLYPGAHDALSNMVQKAPTILWTQGKGNGIEKEGSTERSTDQLRKLVGGGIGDVRRQEAARILLANSQDGRMHLNDVMTTIASKDKLSSDDVGKAATYMKGHDVRTVYVVEDRIKNIQALQRKMAEAVPERDFAVKGIWVRQGKHAHTTPHELPEDVQAVSSIAEVGDLAESMGKGAGFMVDFDGVLSDQAKRIEKEIEAVQGLIQANGWL